MIGETCDTEQPERPGTACDRRPHQNIGFHRDSRTGAVWEADPPPVVSGTGKDALAAIAARTTRHHPTGPVIEAVTTWKDRHGG